MRGKMLRETQDEAAHRTLPLHCSGVRCGMIRSSGCLLPRLLLLGYLTTKKGVVFSLLALLWDTNTQSPSFPCLDSPLVLPIRAGVDPCTRAGSSKKWGRERQRLERQNWTLVMPITSRSPLHLPSQASRAEGCGAPGSYGVRFPCIASPSFLAPPLPLLKRQQLLPPKQLLLLL